MLRNIVDYILANSWKQICVDIEEYGIIKRRCSDVLYRLDDARRVLVRPYISHEKEIVSCIRREVNFPMVNEENQSGQPIIIEHSCNNFNERDLKCGDICQNEMCPSYKKYKHYAMLKRQYDLLTEEKKNFWKNKLLARQK